MQWQTGFLPAARTSSFGRDVVVRFERKQWEKDGQNALALAGLFALRVRVGTYSIYSYLSCVGTVIMHDSGPTISDFYKCSSRFMVGGRRIEGESCLKRKMHLGGSAPWGDQERETTWKKAKGIMELSIITDICPVVYCAVLYFSHTVSLRTPRVNWNYTVIVHIPLFSHPSQKCMLSSFPLASRKI
jgi:hypothetical protein